MRRSTALLIVAFHLLTSVAAIAARLSGIGPGAAAAVVFMPGSDATRNLLAVASAGGRIVRPAAAGWIWVAYAEDSGFFARVRAAGALFSIDPIIVGGCAGTPGTAADRSSDTPQRKPTP